MKLKALLEVIREDQSLIVIVNDGHDTRELGWSRMNGDVLNYHVTEVSAEQMPPSLNWYSRLVIRCQEEKPDGLLD